MDSNSINITTPQKAAKIWVILAIAALSLFFVLSSLSYSKVDAVSIWILTCISMIYFSTKTQKYLGKREQIAVVLAGFGICIFSFLNIPLGLGNPPFSIAEFSLLLSGISIVVFGLLAFRTLIFPLFFPIIAVLGFEMYEIFIRHEDWLIAPLIPPTITLTTGIIRLMGIDPSVNGNIISFLSISGETIRLAVVSDCTGIWSLGTFTVASIIVLSTFPEAISKRGALLILIGYIGTYASNIGRIAIISLSGYIYGPEGIIEQVHIHTGWILFTAWMVIFWYYFFTRHLGFSFTGKKRQAE
ncbi:exosortase/archaeosortase family protein [Methanogenium sp. S4BF]|uniref:exosortase/archaeosortase family protein n=1 Tax=Methanogenium sp. S4BF TaxID=1789226 RepID=UPI002415C7FF|nr:exosortase/archaeosortase family protein [Methanogenium sp. S4BF]WFN35128.1 exosortase/archaeosortase family protein [Methanogenium sp. S4BF]